MNNKAKRAPINDELKLHPRVIELSNEVYSLLEAHELQSKLSRLPADLPSVKLVKEQIESFLDQGTLSAMDQNKTDVALNLDRNRLEISNAKSWNDMILEIVSIIDINEKKGLVKADLIKDFVIDLKVEIPSIIEEDVPKAYIVKV